jgi:cleavage and polyadenylation specificity factor subunit 3
MTEPSEITALATQQKIPRRCSVEEISFAAHVDFTHNSNFIELVGAKHIVTPSDLFKPNFARS